MFFVAAMLLATAILWMPHHGILQTPAPVVVRSDETRAPAEGL